MAYQDPERYIAARKKARTAWAKRKRDAMLAASPEELKKKDKRSNDQKQERVERMRVADPEAYAEYRKVLAQRLRNYRHKTRTESPGLHIWREVKRRCFHMDVPFTIAPEDVVVPDTCPVLGVPLRFNVGKKGAAPNSPSLDKIVPALGYVPGNVQVISHLANLMKNSATQQQLVAFATWVLSTYGEHNEQEYNRKSGM